ncbi:hypothetical protein M8542_39970 [Amycolatopsis sp. OK19-0408]|uniref:Uncharacterized protein n=1 Tax=Amycolatopsis iheyensis TaxID=2945988 RepID=A0A9X2SNN8_9PSEU|nr:hypothetical protein [Amycolatopsis iheyensis]MCR6489024.1 hypothetical protein [Amycolatopsis iheyensis]
MSGYDEWQWVTEHPSTFEDDGRLTFVRDTTADAVFRAHGLDPARARPRKLIETWGPSGLPHDGRPCVRLATEGAWTAVIQPVRASADGAGRPSPLAALGPEVFSVALNTMGPGELSHFLDGRPRFVMGLGEPYDSRTGDLAERWAGPLRAAGFFTASRPPSPAAELVAALAMGSRELGFTLSAERCRGPLPTVYR